MPPKGARKRPLAAARAVVPISEGSPQPCSFDNKVRLISRLRDAADTPLREVRTPSASPAQPPQRSHADVTEWGLEGVDYWKPKVGNPQWARDAFPGGKSSLEHMLDFFEAFPLAWGRFRAGKDKKTRPIDVANECQRWMIKHGSPWFRTSKDIRTHLLERETKYHKALKIENRTGFGDGTFTEDDDGNEVFVENAQEYLNRICPYFERWKFICGDTSVEYELTTVDMTELAPLREATTRIVAQRSGTKRARPWTHEESSDDEASICTAQESPEPATPTPAPSHGVPRSQEAKRPVTRTQSLRQRANESMLDAHKAYQTARDEFQKAQLERMDAQTRALNERNAREDRVAYLDLVRDLETRNPHTSEEDIRAEARRLFRLAAEDLAALRGM